MKTETSNPGKRKGGGGDDGGGGRGRENNVKLRRKIVFLQLFNWACGGCLRLSQPETPALSVVLP